MKGVSKLNKKDIIHLLEQIALYLELKGENAFRIAAYRKAAQGLEKDVRSLSEINDFKTIAGIGKGTAEVINEYIAAGQSPQLNALKNEVPEGLIPLLKLPGLGGKRLSTLYHELGITDQASLRAACENGTVAELKGFGKKTVGNILIALEAEGQRPERLPVALMLKLKEEIESRLDKIDAIQKYALAGSLRRLKETIKDVDFIIVPKAGERVRQQLVDMDLVDKVIANGETKVSVTVNFEYEINIDFRIVDELEFATTLHHFTGSKEHNVHMRQLAKARGEKINEYGVEIEGSDKILTFKNEEGFYKHFGLKFIPPELREDQGEIELFKQDVTLLKASDIRADLHMHTTWSDGAESIEEMVNHARELGYSHLAITDHSKFLQVANGLNESRLRQQREEIEKLKEKYTDIDILCGVEMDIKPDGSLDFSNDFLKEMDWVIAAIHSSFNQTESEIMKRLTTALENPYVNIIAHPTGRLIGRREGYAVNVSELIQKAKATHTALELNANPMRFDLATEFLKEAKGNDVPIAINTDAHNTRSFQFMDLGVKMARKAYLEKTDVINTWSIEQLKAFIDQKCKRG